MPRDVDHPDDGCAYCRFYNAVWAGKPYRIHGLFFCRGLPLEAITIVEHVIDIHDDMERKANTADRSFAAN